MESSTPPASASADESNAQDPLALPNANDNNIGLYHDDVNRDRNGLCGNESALSISCNNDKESSISDNPTNSGIYSNDPSIIKHEEHPLNNEQRLQYDANHQMSSNYANSDQQKMNQLSMQQQQNLHEPHKTFSHSIENLSKTTEKCAPNEMKIFPNLIDGHDQYDDGYETGVGDLLSHKYKLPSLPPPSSSPYSSLSSSSMSTISNATTTPTNLVNPQQQQSPSYMGGNGNAGNNMNQYQQQQQQQQQQQLYNQNHQQYQSMQHPIPPQSHQNSFNYHHMFGRIQQQQQQQQQPQQLSGAIKNEPPMTPTDNDPYRFVDDDLSNGLNSHSGGMHGSIHPHHQHMSPAGMSGNYSTSSSPMPPQMQQQTPTGNASMMQFNDHMPHHQHHMHGHQHMNHINHQQQMQSQHMNPHLMNGNINSPSIGHGGMNPMLMNDTPKKRGRKKKLRDENGNPIEDRPVKERKKHDRFNGMPEEEVTKRTLPDHLTGNLDIVIVGINPGLFAAFKGHHYAGPGNHFWKCLYLSGLTSVQMTAEEDYKLLQYGIGFTNMVQRPTKGSADLTRKEIKEGSRVLLDKIRKFQPKIAVFNGKLIFEVFSGKKDFCFGKQPETVEGTNTYMWVMPSSSARCAQLPRAADKVPFYAALKKFRDYLNGLVPEYEETDYVFNDPKYSQISTEAELKEEAIAFTSLEGGEVVVMADPNKKKRGRPKKVRGENGEEIPTPKQRKNNENLNSEGNEDDPTKKKRGRPKKSKDGTTTPAPSKKKTSKQSSKDQMMDSNSPQHLTPPSSVPPQVVDMNSMSHHNAQGIQHQQHPGMLSNNCNNGNVNRPFLPPMESPTAINYNGAINQQNHMQQQNRQQSQNTSPVNLCFPQTNLDPVAQPEMSPHHQQAYQQRQTPSVHQQMFGANSSSPEMPSDISANINNEQMTSPIASSPTLAPTDFEPPQAIANGRNSNELNPYSQMQSTSSLEQQHQTHSPSSQTQSPIGMAGLYSQQQQSQPQMSHMISNISNGSPYSPYSRQHSQQQIQHQQQQQQQQQQQPSYPNHQQSPHQHGLPSNNVNTKQMNQHMNGGTDPYKDVATKSLSGLESLVDQIPNLNEQEAALGSLTHTVTPHNGNIDVLSSSSSMMEDIHNLAFEQPSSDPSTNGFSGYSSSGTPNLAATSPSVASSSSLLPSLGPPHHHSHYPYTSHAASQSPYSANPFSVSSLTSSTYPSAAAAAMNSYHQNLMNSSHLTSSFMEPPHMPVPVSPLYHSYQQQGYPGYAPPHPSALHMSNYPYYTNTGYTQAPGSSYHHSMFDRINF